MKARIGILLLLLGICAGLRAQESHLTVDADFMTRGEIRNGGLTGGEDRPDYAAFILERTLLGLGYEKGSLSARLTAQHSGTWGSAEGGLFNVYEAWAQLKSEKGFFAKVGRQNLSYDDQRIFGADDWAMTARSHDVAKFGYEGHGHKVHLFGSFNQNLANVAGGTYFSGGIQPYKSLGALWYHFDFSRIPLGISLLAMDAGMQGGEEGEENERTYHQQLVGSFVSFRPKHWELEAAYYHQLGKSEVGLPIDAWMASAKGTWNPDAHWSVFSGYDYLSGDPFVVNPPEGQIGMIRHETIRGFSSLYGSHHKFYGAMDFFYVTTYMHGFTPGLQNLYAGTTWKPKERLSLSLAYHFLAIATQVEGIDRPLGHEVELSAAIPVTKEATLSFGYSYMRGTHTMEVLKRSTEKGRLHWGWIMLNVTPKFLSGK